MAGERLSAWQDFPGEKVDNEAHSQWINFIKANFGEEMDLEGRMATRQQGTNVEARQDLMERI